MTAIDPAQLTVAALMCGVLATWLFGALLHVRLTRWSLTNSRRFFRALLPVPPDHALSRVVVGLNQSPHFIATLTGRLGNVIIASVRPARRARGHEAARLACRIEDHGSESQVRVRLDFTPLSDRILSRSRLMVLVLWPVWMGLVVVAVLALLTVARYQGFWSSLHLLHAVYPLAALLLIHSGYRRHRTRLTQAVGAMVENLRFLPG